MEQCACRGGGRGGERGEGGEVGWGYELNLIDRRGVLGGPGGVEVGGGAYVWSIHRNYCSPCVQAWTRTLVDQFTGFIASAKSADAAKRLTDINKNN